MNQVNKIKAIRRVTIASCLLIILAGCNSGSQEPSTGVNSKEEVTAELESNSEGGNTEIVSGSDGDNSSEVVSGSEGDDSTEVVSGSEGDNSTAVVSGSEGDNSTAVVSGSEGNNNSGTDNTSETETTNQTIVVSAGNDFTLFNDETLTLEGTTNFSGGVYVWSQVSGPTVVITSSDSSNTTALINDVAHNSELVFKLTVTDDSGKSASDDITVLIQDKINAALVSGNPTLLPDSAEPILTRIMSVIEEEKIDNEAVLNAIYGQDEISYEPSQSSQFFTFMQTEGVYPILQGTQGSNLAAAVNINGQHNAAFGTNIIRNLQDGSYLSYEDHFINLLAWLLKRDSETLADNATISLALMDSTTATRTTNWLNSHFENWTVTHCVDESLISSCVSDADLVVTGSNYSGSTDVALAAIDNAQTNGVALLYVHLHGWSSSELGLSILSKMNLGMQGSGGPGNYFKKDKATWESAQQMFDTSWSSGKTYQLVSNLKNNTFEFDLKNCAIACDEVFNSGFKAALTNLRSIFNSFDAKNINIFESELYQTEKLLVLLGDFYRQSIRYPMDIETTEPLEFLQAYFADHVVYNSRSFNMLQTDLGNFSRTDFSHITPVNKAVNLTSKKSFRSTGVYALPTQTMTVTRTDNSDVNVSVFINTQRSSATHEFDENKYNRPKYLQSAAVTIAPGETISLNSPYGGPVQLKFSTNDEVVALSFSHVGEHPHWASSADNESFADKMAAADYDWAEIATPHFEVHSRLDKMLNTLSSTEGNTAADTAGAIEQYIHNFPHVLAGFQGPGIDVIDEIHDFANDKGWTIDTLDMVKHMNADQATCGSGCSGNPYDAYWSFTPTGHGDIHELGHGLEKGKFRFAGWDGHASTNPYSYYSKTQYHELTETESSCQNLPSQDLFVTLQESLKQDDAFAYMQSSSLTGWNQGMAIYIQMMMAAQDQATFSDGWNLLPRLHILLREFERADNDDETWLAKRDSLGFGNFTRAEAKALNNNDWLVIAISVVTERDYRDFITMWGLSFSAEASAQVDSLAYGVIAPTFYQTSGNDYCLGLDKEPVVISDRDGDGVIDAYDAFPDNSTENSDADGDGVGDNEDLSYDLDPSKLTYQHIEIKSVRSGECISVESATDLSGQSLVSSTCNASDFTLWSWSEEGQLHLDSEPSLCITAVSLNSGAQLMLASCSSSSTQMWNFDQNTAISSVSSSGLAFDLYSNKEVHLYGSHAGTNQQWLLESK